MSTPEQPGPDRPDAARPAPPAGPAPSVDPVPSIVPGPPVDSVPPIDPIPPIDPASPVSPAPAPPAAPPSATAAPGPTPASGWGDSPRYGQYGQQPGYGQQPQYGQYGQQPRYGQYGQPAGQQPAATSYGTPLGAPYRPPAVKPGIVPLRPMTLGEIYDGAFSAVRHNPAVMLGLATLVLLAATVVGVLVGQLLVPAFTSLFGPIFDDPALQDPYLGLGITPSTIAQLYGSTSGMALSTLLAGPIVNGVLTVSVSRSVLGDKAGVRQVWARVAPRVWLLIGWSVLQTLGVMVVAVVLVTVVVAITLALAQASGVAAALLAILLAVASGAVLAWLGIRLLLVPPALALEGAGLWATVKRAWLLTRGSFWRTLGIYLLASVIVYVIAQVVSIPLGLVVGAIGGANGAAVGSVLIVSILSGVVAAAIQTIFVAGVTALLYIDLRMRREGLDVQLTAAAAERRG